MKEILRILQLEDNTTDAEEISDLLKQDNIFFEIMVVRTGDSFIKALHDFIPDIILADYLLPSFNALEALEAVKKEGRNIPFILVTDTIPEELALQLVKMGAVDYIFKDNLRRLPMAIGNAVERSSKEAALEKLEERMKRSGEFYRSLVEQAADGIFIVDQQGYFIEANENGCKMMGYSKEEIPGLNLKHITPERFSGKIPADLSYLNNGNNIMIERQFVKKDGTLFCTESSAQLISGGYIQAIVRDITDRKKAESQIRDSEERYRFLIEQASDGVIVYSFDGTIYDFNQCTYRMLGYTRPEFEKLKLRDLLFDDIIISRENADKIRNGETALFNRSIKKKNGDPLEVEINARILPDGRNLAFVRDITERKKTELRAQKALERYDILAKATSDTIWDWDIVNNTMQYNEGITNMLGYGKSDIKNVITWWKKNIHPEDAQLITAQLEDVFKNGTQNLQMEYRYRCADKLYKHILDRAFVIYDESGKPVRVIGAMQDITERKKLKEKIAFEKMLKQKDITEAVVGAQEVERSEIGMELHDNVNQLLGATRLYIDMARKDNKNRDSLLVSASGYILTAIEEIRKLSRTLITPLISETGLEEAVDNLIKEITTVHTIKIRPKLQDFTEDNFSHKFNLNIFRIIQEQLNNIIKHAKATDVEISIKETPEQLFVTIKDNGVGFNSNMKRKGVGISNIVNRAELYKGDVLINTAPGKGCTLSVSFLKTDLLLKQPVPGVCISPVNKPASNDK